MKPYVPWKLWISKMIYMEHMLDLHAYCGTHLFYDNQEYALKWKQK